MVQRSATIHNVTQACRIIKQMSSQGVSWSEDYRVYGRNALKEILEERMNSSIDSYLDELGCHVGEDRRNGSYSRHLLTELGDIELEVPRTRHFSAVKVVRAYARRAVHIDRLILSCFVLGVSTRKVGKALLPILGEKVSASTVSRVGKQLDQVVQSFHRRPLKDQYRVLIFDGVVLSRKSGAGALRRPVLVALGIRPDGKKEIIDFRLAHGESQTEWEAFLNDLYNRGLKGENTELIVTDGGLGLLAGLPLVYSHVPLQRCWAHKIRNILDKVKKKDHLTVKQGLNMIVNASNLVKARQAIARFTGTWDTVYPKAVKCLKDDIEDLLTFFTFKDPSWWKAIRTTNSIERRFREVRRRTRPMGVFSDRTSIERILYAVFSYENSQQGISTPFLVTQNS